MSERKRSCWVSNRKVVAATSVVLLLMVFGATSLQAKATLDDVAFLAGCWEGEVGDGSTIRETYTHPRGGSMLGNSQVVAAGKTQFFEFIKLSQTEAGVVYQPSPNAKDSVAFPLVKSSGTEVVFENAAHDFPQRIVYRLDGKNVLTARIEKIDGKDAQSFEMNAVACGGEAHQRALTK